MLACAFHLSYPGVKTYSSIQVCGVLSRMRISTVLTWIYSPPTRYTATRTVGNRETGLPWNDQSSLHAKRPSDANSDYRVCLLCLSPLFFSPLYPCLCRATSVRAPPRGAPARHFRRTATGNREKKAPPHLLNRYEGEITLPLTCVWCSFLINRLLCFTDDISGFCVRAESSRAALNTIFAQAAEWHAHSLRRATGAEDGQAATIPGFRRCGGSDVWYRL